MYRGSAQRTRKNNDPFHKFNQGQCFHQLTEKSGKVHLARRDPRYRHANTFASTHSPSSPEAHKTLEKIAARNYDGVANKGIALEFGLLRSPALPNTFAFVALYSWPLLAILLFRLLPMPQALVWTILGGYLLLPERVGINLPMIPVMDKTLVPAVAALFMCRLIPPQTTSNMALKLSPDLSATGRQLMIGLLGLVLLAPFITVMQNFEPVIAGPRIIPGLRLYDALAIIGSLLVMLIPFMLAQRYLASAAAHRMLMAILVAAMLAYTLPMLIEMRLSPQLHHWIYGFFPHRFDQHMRGGAFRPLVFLNHGLWLGILMAMAVVAACALWRQALRDRVAAAPWLWAMVWLCVVLVLSRNLGATALSLLAAPMVLFAGLRLQMITAAVVAGMVLTYPMLRGADWVPTGAVLSISESINPERARSLAFRLDNEDRLLDRANQKPLGGWGTWGRNRVYDQETGRDLSVTDGYWIIIIGSYGWLGYIGHLGLLTLPLVLLACRRRAETTPATAGLTMVLAVALIDLIPNATISPVTWLIAGALTGHAMRVSATGQFNARLVAAPPRWQVDASGGPLRPVGIPESAAEPTALPFRHRRRPRA